MKDMEICIVLVAGLDESFNVLQNRGKIKFLLLLFLTLESTLCSIDVFFSHYSFFFSLMAIPSANIFDSFDWSKLVVINIDVMSDTNKRLVDISDWIQSLTFLLCCFICLTDLVIQFSDIAIE